MPRDPYLVGSTPRAADALAQLDALPRFRVVRDDTDRRHTTSRVCPRHLLAPPSWEPPGVGLEHGRFCCGLCGRRLVRRVTYQAGLARRHDWERSVSRGGSRWSVRCSCSPSSRPAPTPAAPTPSPVRA
jgi:hypothetical protein